MTRRQFRTDASIEAEKSTRDAVIPLLLSYGFSQVTDERTIRGTSVSQVVHATSPAGTPAKMHVRLCWRRTDRTIHERSYSAAQLRARLIDGDWAKTLAFIAERELAAGNDSNLFLQSDGTGFAYAALGLGPINRIHNAVGM